MHLTPREIEKLMLHNAGFVAQKRLARGCKLNQPETVALIATVVMELIRDGKRVAECMDLGRQMLGRRQVMPGIAEMLHDVQVEATFPDGSKLVTVHHPIAAEDGNLELALYGSFLPVPDLSVFGEASTATDSAPGQVTAQEGDIELNAGRETVSIDVTNTGDRPIQVGSHYHFIETNAGLTFDRSASYGKRLDIPAGTAVRFEPGETKTVTLVAIAGDQIIRGGNNLADGQVGSAQQSEALKRVEAQGFGNATN
ncbi:MAG: urease subunit beta [Planctomycetota bacterium]